MHITSSYINDLLVKEDLEGLIEAGAPADEYESEAEEISKAINKLKPEEFNIENILSIISILWMKNFELIPQELALRLDSIKKITKQIKSSVR